MRKTTTVSFSNIHIWLRKNSTLFGFFFSFLSEKIFSYCEWPKVTNIVRKNLSTPKKEKKNEQITFLNFTMNKTLTIVKKILVIFRKYYFLVNYLLSLFIFRAQDRDQCLILILSTFKESLVNLRDRELRTLLHIAAYQNSIACFKVLLNNGAAINLKDSHNRTPLMLSCYMGHQRIVGMKLLFFPT